MEVYPLDGLLRRQHVIDRFHSCIWTERFAAQGDFELSIFSTNETRGLLQPGTKLAMNSSNRIMTVETVENKLSADGEYLLTAKGASLEKILEDRICNRGMVNLTTEPKWHMAGTPGELARYIFEHICITGYLSPNDIIPFYTPGTLYPMDTIAETATVITLDLPPTTVYEAIKDICTTFGLGFRLYRNLDSSELYFNIYAGSDRTTRQLILPPVVFSPDLDNLQNTTELTTIALYKNVAVVFSPAGVQTVYPLDVDPAVDGFDRRVLVVVADDITSSNPNVTAALQQRGREELAKNKRFSAFDGEINQNSAYKYGRDYNLGDLVEVRNVDGATNNMRVTEQIFVADREGERSYPTLELEFFIEPGSWLGQNYKVWEDMGLTEYWADQL